jgi:hypothetical protein
MGGLMTWYGPRCCDWFALTQAAMQTQQMQVKRMKTAIVCAASEALL